MSLQMLTVGLGAASLLVALGLMSQGRHEMRAARGAWLWLPPLALCFMFAGDVAWLVCDARGSSEARAGIAAVVMGVSAQFYLAAIIVILRLQRRISAHTRSLELKVAERTERAREATRRADERGDRLQAVNDAAGVVPFEFDLECRRFSWMMGAEQALGYLPTGLDLDAIMQMVAPEDRPALRCAIDSLVDGRVSEVSCDYRAKVPGQSQRWMRLVGKVDELRPTVVRGVLVDSTERKQLEVELQQAHKLEAIGQLASGIAHEVNTPIQFVGDSVSFVKDASESLFTLIDGLVAEARGAGATEEALAALLQNADLDYTRTELPEALARALDGVKRVTDIVRAMKEFAHTERKEQQAADLNRALQSTLIVARNEYKYVANVETSLGELPAITCRIGALNQVFLNLIVNGAHAIADRRQREGTEALGTIRLETRLEGDRVIVAVSDTGGGIPPEIRARVFEPFFTTKGVGRGTGQGLAIAHTIVEQHAGRVWFDSTVGQGTTFFVALPINGASPEGEGARLREYLEQHLPDPHTALIRVSLRTGIPLESLRKDAALLPEQLRAFEESVKDLLGVDTLALEGAPA